MHMNSKTDKNEGGFASITVAFIFVLILALITVGFAQLARREQRSSLDKQLTTQAYYAAETGINDVTPKLKDGSIAANGNKCIDFTANGLQPKIKADGSVAYSCIIVDTQPSSLLYGDVPANEGQAAVFGTKEELASFTIEWGSLNPTKRAAGAFRNASNDINYSGKEPTFNPEAAWPNPAVLQVSITPLDDTSRAAMLANTFTTYMYPSKKNTGGQNSISYSNIPANQGITIAGECDAAPVYTCSGTINFNAPRFAAGTYFAVHVVDYYDDSSVRMQGQDSFGKPVHFLDGQVAVDSTGKAKDVLKRLQVRIPVEPLNNRPDYAFRAGVACKRQMARPFTGDPRSGVTFDTLYPSCELNKF